MSTKNTSKSSKIVKYFAIGGLGIAVLGASYFLYKHFKKQQTVVKRKSLPKELVIKILHEIRRDLFHVYKSLESECKRYRESKGVTEIPADYKAELIKSTKADIDAITNQVLAKNNVDILDYNYSMELVYKSDPTVKTEVEAIDKDMDNAMESKLEVKTAIPAFLTTQKTLEVYAKSMKAYLKKINEIGQEAIFKDDEEEFRKKFRSLEAIAAKEQVMREEGLGTFEDHPDKILSFAVTEYSKTDSDFKAKIAALDAQTAELIEKIFHQHLDLEEAFEAFGKNITE